jgi:hypothetical protein
MTLQGMGNKNGRGYDFFHPSYEGAMQDEAGNYLISAQFGDHEAPTGGLEAFDQYGGGHSAGDYYIGFDPNTGQSYWFDPYASVGYDPYAHEWRGDDPLGVTGYSWQDIYEGTDMSEADEPQWVGRQLVSDTDPTQVISQDQYEQMVYDYAMNQLATQGMDFSGQGWTPIQFFDFKDKGPVAQMGGVQGQNTDFVRMYEFLPMIQAAAEGQGLMGWDNFMQSPEYQNYITSVATQPEVVEDDLSGGA